MARSRLPLALLALGLVLLLACCASAGSSSSESAESPESPETSESSESREHRSRKHGSATVEPGTHRQLSEAELSALLRSIVFKKPAVVTYDVDCDKNAACNEISNDFRR